nr:immunoglobulin heavy chain junction region [Mus musculus]MBK4196572.1 immunoglobulin heavy chain junction region [Mus musculus]
CSRGDLLRNFFDYW